MRLLVILLALLAALPALACPAAQPPAAARTAIDLARPDQAVLSAAVISQVNALRCSGGLAALDGRAGLRRVAARHSAYLAKAQTLSHDSTLRGEETLSLRLRASGERFRAGAENVGFLRGCGRNYLELANAMVRIWVDSRPHRENMLNPSFTRAAAGVAFAGGCARAYLTLDLAG